MGLNEKVGRVLREFYPLSNFMGSSVYGSSFNKEQSAMNNFNILNLTSY